MKKYYSQNDEDKVISEYFNDYVGTVLDIGANDGETFSNSLKFIQDGWSATLVEPSDKCFKKLKQLHSSNPYVEVFNVGVGASCGTFMFHESGEHIGNGDHSLVSTFDERELSRWTNEKFEQIPIQVIDIARLVELSKYGAWDYITMDIEGLEVDVLPQMDLIQCKCLCVEYNGKSDLLDFYTSIASKFGLKEFHRNNENVIYGR